MKARSQRLAEILRPEALVDQVGDGGAPLVMDAMTSLPRPCLISSSPGAVAVPGRRMLAATRTGKRCWIVMAVAARTASKPPAQSIVSILDDAETSLGRYACRRFPMEVNRC